MKNYKFPYYMDFSITSFCKLNEKQDLKNIIKHEYNVSTKNSQIDLDDFFTKLMSLKIISPKYYKCFQKI